MNDRIESFSICIHTNGDCRLKRSGYLGAEYWQYDDLLHRIKEFSIELTPVHIRLDFCEGDSEQDFYMPDKHTTQKVIQDLLELGVKKAFVDDIPNKRAPDGSYAAIPAFYELKKSGNTKFVKYVKK